MKLAPVSIAGLLLVSANIIYAQSDTAAVQKQAAQTIDAANQDNTQSDVSAAATSAAGVRIVRLSQVKGEAELDRHVDKGYEHAFANLPITQGSKLKTTDGVAEVEFEDNSTLRLTPDTIVEFTELGRSATGATTTSINVTQGTLYASMAGTKGSEFTVNSTQGRLTLTPGSRMHFHVGTPQTTLAVLDGTVQAQAGSSLITVPRKKTLVFDASSQAAPTLVSHLDKDPYDDWDKQAVDYHKRYMNTASFGSGYGSGAGLYGVSDLNYYGSFADMGGTCGSLWRPYLASANWDPYSNGVLAYYPNAGYSWVSPYPWGWAPYHSGSWMNCGAAGWGWRPGNTFTGLANLTAPSIRNRFGRGVLSPGKGHGGLLAVSSTPITASKFSNANTFVFAKDSAGLGVPRETFGKLGKVSSSAIQHGSVTAPAYVAPVAMSSRGESHTVLSEHAGIAPGLAAGHSGPSASNAGFSGGNMGSHSAGSSASLSSSAGMGRSSGSGGAVSSGAAHR